MQCPTCSVHPHFLLMRPEMHYVEMVRACAVRQVTVVRLGPTGEWTAYNPNNVQRPA